MTAKLYSEGYVDGFVIYTSSNEDLNIIDEKIDIG